MAQPASSPSLKNTRCRVSHHIQQPKSAPIKWLGVALTGSERRVVSVILAEPEGVDSAQTVTPDNAHEELTRVQELAATFGAEATSLAGGALIIVLPAGKAATDQASQAASCALGLQRTQPEYQL